VLTVSFISIESHISHTSIFAAMSSRPATLWVPPRGNLPECWLAVHHIVSIYYAGGSVFIELPRKTVQVTYNTRDEAVKAAKCFVDAMAQVQTDVKKAEYPTPIAGSIGNNA